LSITGAASAGTNLSLAKVSGAASARWEDFFEFNTDAVGPGQHIIVSSTLELDGDLFVFASPQANAGVAFEIYDLSASIGLPPSPYGSSIWGSAIHDESVGLVEQNEIPGSIELTQLLRNGTRNYLSFLMSLSGGGSSGSPGGMVMEANVFQSLHWGGVVKVTDLAGNVIPRDHWSITSESGFDYSKPFGVPEPSSTIVICTALCAATIGCRRI
jgi:hypothetical protein